MNSSKELIIDNNYKEKVKKVAIYDLQGKKVKEFSTTSINNISDLKTGVYIVKINLTDKNILNKKIILR